MKGIFKKIEGRIDYRTKEGRALKLAEQKKAERKAARQEAKLAVVRQPRTATLAAKANVTEMPKQTSQLDLEFEKELRQQPEDFLEAAMNFIRMEDEFKRMKEDLSLLEIKLDGEYREQVKEKGEKFTEKVVENYVESHSEIVELKGKLRYQERKMKEQKAKVEYYEHRKAMLESIARIR